jgi:hypothetical protein
MDHRPIALVNGVPIYADERAVPVHATESIDRAAIAIGGEVYSVPRPGRHCDVYALVLGHRSARRDWQGFVTTTGRFVGRREAHRIASAAGQIIKRCGGDAETLYSENLW